MFLPILQKANLHANFNSIFPKYIPLNGNLQAHTPYFVVWIWLNKEHKDFNHTNLPVLLFFYSVLPKLSLISFQA